MRKWVGIAGVTIVAVGGLGIGAYTWRAERIEAGRCAVVDSLSEATTAPIGSGPALSVVGDSYAQGFGLDDPRTSWTAYLDRTVTLHAASGAGFTRSGLCGAPNLVSLAGQSTGPTLVEGGLNDVTATPAAVASAAARALAEANDPVALVGPPPAPELDQTALAYIDDALRRTAANEGVEYISTLGWDDLEYVDGLHLTADSHRIFGERIAEQL